MTGVMKPGTVAIQPDRTAFSMLLSLTMRSFTALLILFAVLTVSLHSQEIQRKPLILSQGGTPEKPAVFDGKGMVIDLGIDITAHDWVKNGEVWPAAGAPAGGRHAARGLVHR